MQACFFNLASYVQILGVSLAETRCYPVLQGRTRTGVLGNTSDFYMFSSCASYLSRAVFPQAAAAVSFYRSIAGPCGGVRHTANVDHYVKIIACLCSDDEVMLSEPSESGDLGDLVSEPDVCQTLCCCI